MESTVFLKTLDDVKGFVAYALSKDYDIELCSNKYIVNAKSIMGVFSLDLTEPIKAVFHTDNDEALINEITPYIYCEENNQ